MIMKRILKLISTVTVCCLLSGCMFDTPQQVEAQTPIAVEEPEPIKTSIPVSFAGSEFDMPLNMAIYHTPNSMRSIPNDLDECFFDHKGEKEDVCLLRAGKLSSIVASTEQADNVMKQFCQAEYYGGVDICYDDTLLVDVLYLQNSVVTGVDDRSYITLTMIPKATDMIYSITFKCDEDEQIIVADNDIKIMLNSLQNYTGTAIKEDFFYTTFITYIKSNLRELESPSTYMPNIPPLKDERSVVVESDQQYYLDLKTGLYFIEVVEGEGEVLIEDGRFGTRKALMGYDSANAPAELSDVTLVHGGRLQTNMGLKIRITK